ncbi:hypothetical protein GCM10017750_08700 [Streptomyces racemochromogenes]
MWDQTRPDARKETGMYRSSPRTAATTATVINPPRFPFDPPAVPLRPAFAHPVTRVRRRPP